MKIGLVSEVFRDGDLEYNLNQMKKHIVKSSEKELDLICFGESFLQGFEGLAWEYYEDLTRACSQDGELILSLREFIKKHHIAVSFGYIERDEETIYSSNLVISADGEIIDNYRRISPGWKEPIADKRYYKEGGGFSTFKYKNKTFATAICGDLWYPQNIDSIKELEVDCVLWPLYIDFSVNRWETSEKDDYALQVKPIKAPVLMINSYVEDENRANGGCYIFQNGHIVKELPMGQLGVLEYEI